MGHPYFDLPTPVVIGHRGCAGEAPENTLESFARGLEDGAAILETDVRVTRDGVPVLAHDPDLGRVSDGSGLVAEHDLVDLQKLDAGFHFRREPGEEPGFRGRGLRIPSLHEAFAAFPDARFNLEIKDDRPGLAEAVVELTARFGREAHTLLTAESGGVMARLHARLDAEGVDAARGASAPDVLGFLRAALDGSPPPPGPMALQVPADFRGQPLVTAPFVDHAHAHGIQVHVWTINEPAEMARLLDLGVDGLVTDFPARLAELVESRRSAS
ncbi:MAG: glycerophosphodiester phosphodiesterase [Myxococcota bacterium]|nr:glycerophosphodiester phosphodiesterase [Myxococcota bacterium]